MSGVSDGSKFNTCPVFRILNIFFGIKRDTDKLRRDRKTPDDLNCS